VIKILGTIAEAVNLLVFSAVVSFGGVVLAVFWLVPTYIAEKVWHSSNTKTQPNSNENG
jgi:hypothetical protein